MNGETMERLLIDSALGALPPDSDQLLKAYLRHDPAAMTQAVELASVAESARDAIGSRVVDAPPPFPLLRVRSAALAQRRLRLLRGVTGLAAMLMIGFLLGRLPAGARGGADSGRLAAAKSRPVERVVVHSEREPSVATAENGLWSSRRNYARMMDAARLRTAPVVWNSPVQKPLRGAI